MTVDIMRNLVAQQHTDIPELRRLLNLAESSVYRYLGETELRAGQLFHLYRHANSDAVRDAFDAELMAGTDRQVVKLPVVSDLNGDGDINTDDALAGAVEVIDKASNAMKFVLGETTLDVDRYVDARRALKDAADQALAAIAVIDFLEAHAPKRNKLNGRGATHV